MQVNILYYLTATMLGGLHALEPGHGKTVVAAYLIGTKGRKTDAVLLGLVVTLTHTFSVILLAITAKVASTRITLTEESLHGYIGIVAGLIILTVGLWMLIARIRGKAPFHFHAHDHGHSHGHSHSHNHGHDHDDDHHHYEPHAHQALSIHNYEYGQREDAIDIRDQKKLSCWQLFLLGVSGGLVPCPAAIAILLAAVGAGRLGEGLTYILLFSLGLACVLIAAGLVVVTAGKLASRFLHAIKFAEKVSIASAAIITFIGIATLFNSLKHLL